MQYPSTVGQKWLKNENAENVQKSTGLVGFE